jgi:hypothetical protein
VPAKSNFSFKMLLKSLGHENPSMKPVDLLGSWIRIRTDIGRLDVTLFVLCDLSMYHPVKSRMSGMLKWVFCQFDSFERENSTSLLLAKKNSVL